MEALHRVADRWDEAADMMDTVARRATQADPAPSAFGVDAPGRLAEVGYALREQWLAATSARQHEAAGLAARLSDVAAALRVVAAGYADTDQAAALRVAAGYADTDGAAVRRFPSEA